LWLSLLAAVGLALFGDLILGLWTQGRVAMHSAVFAWLLASAVASVFWYSAFTVLKATNRHLHAALVLVFASAGTVAIAAALLSWSGNLAHAGLALLVMDGAMVLYALTAAAYLLSERPVTLLLHAMNPRPLIVVARSRLPFH
jgi:O-antigen/teichoic acid export membrane protein